ncbi:putative sporulation protein YtxC [Sporolactobacillus spathodeae]|uniref:Sporulation protein YtxC n=1 Tax=Sporolactobacillus spathodeae TaxID=1465502 RepID=A0ABS2QAB2_9BACL|nr:putative sporulation protein YtxC [Sporolactobacillus spathodeae]MBM7658727.1 putative sporulation protein YtxC [Sporolactobacillus spathodeae]
MEIVFATNQDAVAFYRNLPALFRQEAGVLLINDRLEVFPETIEAGRDFGKLFARFIIEKFEKKWLNEIIEKHYLFTDPEEKLAILAIVAAIFAGEKNDLPATETLPDRRQVIINALDESLLNQSTFTLESILRFRLTAYRDVLRRYIEVAIDEYKLEQEYQVFIDKLRRIIRSYKPLCEKIEVYDDHPFRIYDTHRRLIRNEQSVRSFYPLLKQWGIEAEPSIVLTLIALAPRQVIVYTDRPQHSMMKTLHQVFEERVCFVPIGFRGEQQNLS